MYMTATYGKQQAEELREKFLCREFENREIKKCIKFHNLLINKIITIKILNFFSASFENKIYIVNTIIAQLAYKLEEENIS